MKMTIHLPSEAKPAPRQRRLNWAWCAVLTAFALSLIRLTGLAIDFSVNVLFGDQWDFLAPLFYGEGPLASFLQQHGPPRQGLGGVLQWISYTMTAWDARVETGLMVVMLTATAALFTALSARLRGHLSPVDALFPLVVLSPIHWETMFLAINCSHSILPLLLIALLAWTRVAQPSAKRAFFTGILGGVTLFTGFGLCAAAALGGLCLVQGFCAKDRQDRQDAALTLLCLGIGLVLFRIGYVWSPAIPNWAFPVSNWWDYGTFGIYMASTLLGFRSEGIGAFITGGVLVVASLTALIAFCRPFRDTALSPRSAIIFLLTATAFVFMLMTAVGRLPIGIEAAFAWRYVTLISCMLMGLFFSLEAAKPVLPKWADAGMLILAVASAFSVWGNFITDQYIALYASAKKQWIAEYLATGDFSEASQRAKFWVYPPEITRPEIIERLHWLEKNRLSFFSETLGENPIQAPAVSP